LGLPFNIYARAVSFIKPIKFKALPDDKYLSLIASVGFAVPYFTEAGLRLFLLALNGKNDVGQAMTTIGLSVDGESNFPMKVVSKAMIMRATVATPNLRAIQQATMLAEWSGKATFFIEPASIGGRKGTHHKAVVFQHRGAHGGGSSVPSVSATPTGLTLDDHYAVFVIALKLARRVSTELGQAELEKLWGKTQAE
jgi:hypothetical protein